MRLTNRARGRVDSEHVVLLKGLMLWVVIGTAFLAAWHYGLLQRVWREDATGIALAITLVFLGTALRGSWQIVRMSRALNHLAVVQRRITGPTAAAATLDLPDGCVTEHIRHLHLKARHGGGVVGLDQGHLLDSFEAELRASHDLGWFIADLLLSLGLLGTVIGFIVMLGPISGLDTTNEAAIKDALAAMSGGMAVALYTTLAGLIGGMLLKLQGYLLDGAIQELVRRTTQLTEIYVMPVIERMQRHAPA